MKIVNAWPPNIKEIREAFDLSGVTPVFTYGDTMYNPSGHKPDPALIAHEETHVKQQAEVGGPEEWWKRYLVDPEFRAGQEIAAYRAHFRALRRLTKDRNYIARQVHDWASNLSGKMYGGCVSYPDAVRRIRMGITG